MHPDMLFLVYLSYVEIYNDNFRDLLAPGPEVGSEQHKIEIRESK